MAIKFEGGGWEGKALMAWPLVEDFFFAAFLNNPNTIHSLKNVIKFNYKQRYKW